MKLYCRACEPSHEHDGIREFINHHSGKIVWTLFGLLVLLWKPIVGALVLAPVAGQWTAVIRLSENGEGSDQ